MYEHLFNNARAGHESIVSFLLQHGCDVNAKNEEDLTPLLVAEFHRPSLIKVLLDAGADVHLVDPEGLSPLHLAASAGNIESVRLLLAAGSNVDLADSSGRTALHIAVEDDNEEVAMLFMQLGAKINHESCDFSVLAEAGMNANLDLVKELMMRGADMNFQNYDGSTSLFYLAWVKEQHLLKEIVDQTTDVNHRDRDGVTPLHIAAVEGNLSLCKLLLDRGAEVNAKSLLLETPILWATNVVDLEDDEVQFAVVRLLLVSGADPNLENRQGITPVLYAAEKLDQSTVQLLVEHDADFNVRDNEGASILHYAARNRCANVIKYFLDKGVDVNVRCNGGRTVLHEAARLGKLSICHFLLNKGFDVHVKSIDGVTPLGTTDVPLENKKLLIEYMAKRCSVGIPINKTDRKVIANNKILQNYFSLCMQELKRMKKEKLLDNVSFHTILMGNKNSLSGLARNDELIQVAFEKRSKVQTEFPIYFRAMWPKFYVEIQRQKVVKKATEFLTDVFRNHDPFNVVSGEVIKYLKDDTLLTLC